MEDQEEEILPTYASATTKDPLPLIAPYVPVEDLFSACLVSRSWSWAFSAHLWTRPHDAWGIGDWGALTRFLLFQRTLSTSPASRSTEHLSLESVIPSIYTSLPPTWLHTLLLRLPALRSLRISAFPLLDHASLTALGNTTFSLRRLSVKDCANVTPAGLVGLLRSLPDLVALDLSGTRAAGSNSVLSALSGTHLRELRLRGVGVSDAALAPVIQGLGTRVGYLDVCGNALSDRTADMLIGYCFAPPTYDRSSAATTGKGLERIGVAGNKFSEGAVQRMLRTTHLKYLDVGQLECVGGIMAAVRMYAVALEFLRVDWKVVLDDSFVAVGELVLVGVPTFAGARVAEGIAEAVGREGLRVLELEMESSDKSGDFSFFGEGGEGDVWGRGDSDGVVGEVDVLRAVAERKRDLGWRGKVRVVRDLDGEESRERGAEGERWGVVREGV